MRIALISDIHANLPALEAVLSDAQSLGVDQIVCLGDLVDLGPEPQQTLQRLQSLGCPCIKGNHDPFTEDFPGLEPLVQWCKEQLSAAELAFLRGLPDRLEVELPGGRRLLCVHGSPHDYDDQILAQTADQQLDDWCQGYSFDILACGHTHVQLLRRHHGRTIVNVGSVGMPFENYFTGKAPPVSLRHSEYAVIDVSESGLGIDLRQVDFDWEAYAGAVRNSGMPDAEAWLSAFKAP